MRKDAAGPERPRKRDRVRNWSEYNRGLIARGDVTVWLSPDLAWHAEGHALVESITGSNASYRLVRTYPGPG